MEKGVVPEACTLVVKVWPELMVPPAGCWVICTGTQLGGVVGVMVAVLLSAEPAVVQALVTRTQYFLTVVTGGVVKVLLSLPTGWEVSGLTPSYH